MNKSSKTSDCEQHAIRNIITDVGNMVLGVLTPKIVEAYKSTHIKSVSIHTASIEIRVLTTLINQAKALGKFNPGVTTDANRCVHLLKKRTNINTVSCLLGYSSVKGTRSII